MRGLVRAVLALLLIVAAVAVAVFFADRPGQVAIVWQGWRIETSVGVLGGAVALLVMAVLLLTALATALWRLPRRLRRRRALSRARAGEIALLQGMSAMAAGQGSAARRHARRATTLLDGAPLPLLLIAEAAAREGDAAAAKDAYSRLLERPDSEFLGLRGLLGQALRSGDDDAARLLAERAQRLRPDADWLPEMLLVLQARAGDWPAARQTLELAARRQTLPAARLQHYRGVVLYELSRDAETRGDARQALKLAARAQQLAPDLAVAVVHVTRLLTAMGKQRAAARAIGRAWRSAPHPELARLYLDIDPGAAALARVTAAQRLASHNPAAAESRLAVAEAALAAQLWGEARHHLDLAAAAAGDTPPRRLCRLMARLEDSEHGDARAARLWLERALTAPLDPGYACARCAAAAPQWTPLCPRCGAFDTMQWQEALTAPLPAPAQQPTGATAPMLASPLPVPPPVRVSGTTPTASSLAPPVQSDI